MNRNIFLSIFSIIILKSVLLLTHHIQEDAFITWRVAQNIIHYGVIGFNGDIRISASSTHLYTFISTFFNLIFGEKNFIYPIIIFNSILFTFGTFYLLKIFLKDNNKIIIGLFLLNFIPPALKISILGMEFGLIFFLYTLLLYFGFLIRKKWAFLVLPILLMWTRLDCAIFLGIFFLYDIFTQRKWNFTLMWGGLIGTLSVLLFNYLYFGELVNNSIIAKNIAYPYQFRWEVVMHYFPQYIGFLKIPEDIFQVNYLTFIIIILEFLAFAYIMLKSIVPNKALISFLFVFSWVKQLIFMGRLSLFDWYYWIPQIFLFFMIIMYILEKNKYQVWAYNFSIFVMIPLVMYQTVHSIATGNGEWNYRRKIGLYLDTYEQNKNETIFLEPAGYIPYFSHLKTIDFTGIVDKGIQKQLEKNNQYFIQPTLQERKPKYYLSLEPKEQFESAKDSLYFYQNYMQIYHFEISKHLNSDSELLKNIYELKPSGRDYWLYRRYDSF